MVSFEGRMRGDLEGLEPMFFAPDSTSTWRDICAVGLSEESERSLEVFRSMFCSLQDY